MISYISLCRLHDDNNKMFLWKLCRFFSFRNFSLVKFETLMNSKTFSRDRFQLISVFWFQLYSSQRLEARGGKAWKIHLSNLTYLKPINLLRKLFSFSIINLFNFHFSNRFSHGSLRKNLYLCNYLRANMKKLQKHWLITFLVETCSTTNCWRSILYESIFVFQ